LQRFTRWRQLQMPPFSEKERTKFALDLFKLLTDCCLRQIKFFCSAREAAKRCDKGKSVNLLGVNRKNILFQT